MDHKELTLEDAVNSLDRANDDHWTTNGLPRCDVLTTWCGREVTRKEITESRPGLTRSDEVNLAAEQVEPESVDEPTAEVLQTEIAILEMEAGALKTRIGELRRRRAALLHRTATEADPNEERDRRIRHIKRQNEMRLELHTQRQALLERLPADLRSPIDVAMQHRQKDNLKRPI